MPLLTYEAIGISALAAAVPATCLDNLEAAEPFSSEEARAIVEKTGIRFRRMADPSVCASDLCFAAAERLLEENDIDRETIDVVLFVSQTPDYRMPATAVLLQDRLRLGMDTAAFDISLGCSGFVYGLSLAYGYCTQPNIRRVLLLNGETRTRAYSMRDKATGLLFGDAGSATLIERAPGLGASFFTLNSDGSRGDRIRIPAGGYRNPSTPESLADRIYEDGSIRNQEQGVMNGRGVFEFLLLEIPKDIKKIFSAATTSVEAIDFFVLHQANHFMNEHIRKRMKMPAAKVPYCLGEYGNTSSVSIPLTMVSKLSQPLSQRSNNLFVCGFGVGLSWASGILPTLPMKVSEIVEVPNG